MPRLLIVAATRAELAALIERLDGREDRELPLGMAVSGSLAKVPVALAWFGVGKSSTAAGVALATTRLRPSAVVQLGIGGAFEGGALAVGEAAVASSELHLDLGVAYTEKVGGGDPVEDQDGAEDGFSGLEELGLPALEFPATLYNRVPVDDELSESLAGSELPLLPFGTAETVTGSRSAARRLFDRSGVAVESMEGAAAAQTCFALGVPFAQLRGISNLVGERDKARWDLPAALGAAHARLFDWLAAGAPGTAGSRRARR